MTVKCEIKLNDPNGNGVFYAGQLISGVVEINLTEPCRVKGISAQFKGVGFCKWTGQNPAVPSITATGEVNKYSQMIYIGRETYLNSKRYLIHKSEQDDYIEIPPGTHTYHIQCQLPPQIPPSIQANLGHICYEIILTFHRSWKFDIKFPVYFNVLIPLNLNNITPIVRQTKLVEQNHKFSSCIGTSQPLILRITLPRTAYAIGEVLSINVDADNLSSVNIKCLRFALKQNIVYYSTIPWPSSHQVTNRKVKHKSGMLPRLNRVNFNQDLTIPYLPVTDDSSRIIKVSYDLEIVTIAKGWHKNKKMLIPIIIGNIPICSQGNNEILPCSNKIMKSYLG